MDRRSTAAEPQVSASSSQLAADPRPPLWGLDRSALARRGLGLLVAVAAVLGALSTFLLAPLHPNMRHAFGVQAVSMFSASETFTHRPLAYRILMDRVAYLA